MILPTKHIPQGQSLLGLGGLILSEIGQGLTTTALWDRLRTRTEVGTFARFVSALDLLYAIGAIELDAGLLRRTAR